MVAQQDPAAPDTAAIDAVPDAIPRLPVPPVDIAPGGIWAAIGSAVSSVVVAVPMSPAGATGVDPAPSGPTLGAGADEAAGRLGIDIAGHVAAAKATGEAGEVVAVPVVGDGPVRSALVVGVSAGDEPALRKAAAAVARRAGPSGVLVTTLATGRSAAHARAVVEAALLASYTFGIRSEPKQPPIAALTLAGVDAAVRQEVDKGVAVATAARVARDLMNTPSYDKTPAWLADRASDIAAAAGLDARIKDERELADGGFGGILAVGMGSARPPRLIELSYAPPGAHRHVVLIGKGITFDSGGLSLKPSDGMVSMKTDMGGGAVVIAVMSALSALGARVRVTGLVPAAENMPSGSAQRPSDVIRHYGGRTVEVLNTDAEGRLVLADAMAYADRTLAPDIVVDIATLTGAAALALGRRYGALFTPDDALAGDLIAAADAAGERLWRMPIVEEYRVALESPIADLRNVADPDLGLQGGAIMAALFLREFAGGRRWAHLDIAGPARSDREDDEITKGGTGYAVRTLLRYLEGLGAAG